MFVAVTAAAAIDASHTCAACDGGAAPVYCDVLHLAYAHASEPLTMSLCANEPPAAAVARTCASSSTCDAPMMGAIAQDLLRQTVMATHLTSLSLTK